MSMNLLNISKEIKKINVSLETIKNENIGSNNNLNDKLLIITDEIKSDINNIYNKLDCLYNFNINGKNDNNNDEITLFLNSINIDNIYINKILILNPGSLNELLLIEDDILEKINIPIDVINKIKNKIQDKLYISNLVF